MSVAGAINAPTMAVATDDGELRVGWSNNKPVTSFITQQNEVTASHNSDLILIRLAPKVKTWLLRL